jgi:MFS family permease
LLWALALSRLDFGAVMVTRAPDHVLSNLRNVLSVPGPILLALAFGLYTFQYSAITGLLPTLLVQEIGLSIGAAGIVGAITVAANAVGNICAGALVRWRVPLWSVVGAAFVLVGVTSFGIFSKALPVALVALCASLSIGLTGLIPGSIFATAQRIASTSALMVITFGLIQQVSNLGNLFGPAILAAFASRYGWSTAPTVFVALMIAGVTVAILMRFVLPRENA